MPQTRLIQIPGGQAARVTMTGLDWKSKFTSAVIRPYFKGEWELRLNDICGANSEGVSLGNSRSE